MRFEFDIWLLGSEESCRKENNRSKGNRSGVECLSQRCQVESREGDSLVRKGSFAKGGTLSVAYGGG